MTELNKLAAQLDAQTGKEIFRKTVARSPPAGMTG
jgi:hypothetical protein